MAVATIACARCGEPTSAESVPPELERWMNLVRPVCAECVAVAEAEETARESEREARRRAAAREKRLRLVGVPPNLRGYGFEHIDMPAGLDRALELARAWAGGILPGLGLVGPVGVGKSRVSVAAANEACWRKRVRWYSAPVLVDHLTMDFESPERIAAMRALTGTFPLVIDDLDKAKPSEHAAIALFEAVDARCDGGGQLLVTTNLQGSELARRWPQPYGEAIVDRLSLLKWTRVAGESKRGNGKGGQ